jgi:lauroyl/myristoyl acyltransferase
MKRWILGLLSVALLRLVACLPLRVATQAGLCLLPVYIPLRHITCERLRRLGLSPPAYYRTRLRLALLSLRHLLGKPDGLKVRVEGGELYAAAQATGRPIVLLGWHQGPVELLHRVPSRSTGRPFFVMTAGAFSPVLARLMANGRAEGRASGAERGAKAVIRPDSLSGLRAWERDRGVLAVMVDQVRGRPEEWLSFRAGPRAVAHAPWPKRLLEWVLERRPEVLAVSARLEGNVVRFRYEAVDPNALKEDVAAKIEAALARAPTQYNWSYPKMRIRRA